MAHRGNSRSGAFSSSSKIPRPALVSPCSVFPTSPSHVRRVSLVNLIPNANSFFRYNSVIFERIGTTEYAIAVVTPQFLDGSPFHISAINKAHDVPVDGNSIHTNLVFNRLNSASFINSSGHFAPPLDSEEDKGLLTALQALAVKGGLTHKNPADCIKAYGNAFGNDYRNVLAVTQAYDDVNSSVKWMEKSTPFSIDTMSWTCRYIWDGSMKHPRPSESERPDPDCSIESAVKNSSNWAVGYYGFKPENSTHSSLRSYPISHCLVEPIPPGVCSLNYNLWLLTAVILANAIKVVVLTTTIMKVTTYPFITLGDAIASFLEYPDPTTKELCLPGDPDGIFEDERLGKKYQSQEYSIPNIVSPCVSEWLLVAEL